LKRRKTKYPRYQDYVIKEGTFIGEFEQMYQDFNDPWHQTEKEKWASDKSIAVNLIKDLNVEKVMELGCGMGSFSNEIARTGVKVLGIDISETAIEKAKKRFPNCRFCVGDILDLFIYRDYQPDLIIMAEITWYILDKLDELLLLLKTEFPNVYLIHLLATYPKDIQKYGTDRFTNLAEIMEYFDMHYLEWGEICQPDNEIKKTYFLGSWK